MTDLREAAEQALGAMLNFEGDISDEMFEAIRSLKAALAEPVQEPVECEPQFANDDGWCDWVCPKPIGYLMQCCDCGLIHEMELRVAKYQPRPCEVFEVVSDPDLEVQFRMKRRDDISPNSDAVWKAMLEASK